MKRFFLAIISFAAFVACEKATFVEEQTEKPDSGDKTITGQDGKIAAISDFASLILDGNESLDIAEMIDKFLKEHEEEKIYPEGSEWHTVETVGPLLTTLWDQYEPFYNLCPKLGPNKDLQAPAGCVTCSVAQFLAYNEFPSGLTDYKAIKNIKNSENRLNIGTYQEGLLAAKFIADISTEDMLDVWYVEILPGNTRGYVNPLAVMRTLKALGYENIKLNIGLDIATIVRSIEKGYPVLASAISIYPPGAHGWVIDGYMKRELVGPEGDVLDSQYLLHFNWGWNGKNNGYFDTGIIDTRKSVIPDVVNPESRDYIYSLGFNTITAEKPSDAE